MRETPRGIVEELREAARLDAIELGVDHREMTGWEAADHIDHLRGHLQRIADGEGSATEIAAEALDPLLWMKSGSDQA